MSKENRMIAVLETTKDINGTMITRQMYFSSTKKALNHYNSCNESYIIGINTLEKIGKEHYNQIGYDYENRFTSVSIYKSILF